MGYYTNYAVTVEEDGDMEVSIAMADKDMRLERLVASYTDYSNPFDEACKWYEWERDMIKMSKDFPKSRFMLEGEGEESGDIWRAWFKAGKSTGKLKAEIKFPVFSESLLT